LELVFEGELLAELAVQLYARAGLIPYDVRLLCGGFLKLDDLCGLGGFGHGRHISAFIVQRVFPAFRINRAVVI